MKKGSKLTGKIIVTILLVMFLFALGGCSKSDGTGKASKDNQFGWWLTTNDSLGTFYNKYEENVAVQWLNNQYWDSETLTIGEEGKGENLKFSFQVPVTGAEQDNFSTMIATGEYPEIIDLAYAGQSPRQLYEDGVLMDITEYVEKYMPNYIEFIEENPQIKPFVTYTDEDDEVHYYSLYTLADNIITPWQGTMYRRDWVVKYAEPTPYVWDWESDYVKDNGHPKHTPLSAAEEAEDFTGWKENEVKEFTSSEGEDPDNDYRDNVIFPSGTPDPYTISDWEWMFEAFQKAINERGYTSDTDSYSTSLYYPGFMASGDLVSSFGGGGPTWYINEDGDATFGGESKTFKTYLEAMNTWNEKGWIDTKFETRASDMFFQINSTGVGQGKVGLWVGGVGMLGTTIRATASYEEDQKDAMVVGASLPVNDVYGEEENKYIEPYTLYQQNILGGPTGFTDKCEGKDLETLFTMFNYRYSKEGGMVSFIGLNEEQYASMEFEPDLYKEIGIDAAYTEIEGEDGITTYKFAVPGDEELSLALRAMRMGGCIQIEGNEDKGYVLDRLYTNNVDHSVDQWTRYTSTGYILDYDTLMDEKDSNVYNKIQTYINDYMAQVVPEMIKSDLSKWNEYTTTINKYGPDQVTEIYQKIINQ